MATVATSRLKCLAKDCGTYPLKMLPRKCTRVYFLFVYNFLDYTHQLKNYLKVDPINYHKEVGR